MTRLPALLLLLLAATGCGSGSGVGSLEESCRRQAYDDPEVADAVMLSNTQLQEVRAPALMQMYSLVREKTRACMGANGQGPSGGVAPVKRY